MVSRGRAVLGPRPRFVVRWRLTELLNGDAERSSEHAHGPRLSRRTQYLQAVQRGLVQAGLAGELAQAVALPLSPSPQVGQLLHTNVC